MDSAKTTKSLLRLKYFYFNDGYFDVQTSAAIDTLTPKRAAVKYVVTTGAAYALDTIRLLPALDSLYHSKRNPNFTIR
jgi:outer membrane protein assembly factor BamA